MTQDILLYLLLFLGIVWLLLGIAFFYYHFASRIQWMKRQKELEKEEQNDTSAHVLVGRSKVPSSRFIPPVPDTSPPENRDAKHGNFAGQNALQEAENIGEEPEDMPEGYDDEEENEMQVSYTTDETDEEEILREELGLALDPMPEVSPSAILLRDLERMRKWSGNDMDTDKEDTEVISSTLRRIHGTELLDKYKAHLSMQEDAHRKVLELIRKAEEDGEEEGIKDTPDIGDAEEKPLSYYL